MLGGANSKTRNASMRPNRVAQPSNINHAIKKKEHSIEYHGNVGSAKGGTVLLRSRVRPADKPKQSLDRSRIRQMTRPMRWKSLKKE